MDITSVSYDAYATSAGPSATGFSIGANYYAETNVPSSSLIAGGSAVSETGLTGTVTVCIQGWDNASRTTSGGGDFRLDNVSVAGTISCDPCGIASFGPGMVSCSAYTAGADAVTVSVPYTGSEDDATVSIMLNGTTPATNTGDDPATVSSGTITFTAAEGDSYTVDIMDVDMECSLTTLMGTISATECPEILPATITVSTDPAAAGGDAAAQDAAAMALDDAMQGTMDDLCVSQGGDYVPAYGSITWDEVTHVGTITGLIMPNGDPYPGTVTFTLRNNIDLTVPGNVGDQVTSGCTGGSVTLNSANGMQGNAPLPATETFPGGTATVNNFSENCLDNNQTYVTDVSGFLFEFSVPVSNFGFYIGDVETRTDGVDGAPATVSTIEGGIYATPPMDIEPGTVDQTLCDGDGTTGYDGCGNDQTIHVQVEGGASTILVTVGEAFGLSGDNNVSFGGVSFGGTCTVLLPVEMTSFTARKQGTDVALAWTTASEENSDFFAVEWSKNGSDFREIGIVKAAGNSIETLSYDFLHENPVQGANYYRLRQVDLNGTMYYSDIKTVDFQGKGKFSVRPTITSGNIEIVFSDVLDSSASLEVYNINGIQVAAFEAEQGTSNVSFDASTLAKGHYFVRSVVAGESFVERFIVK